MPARTLLNFILKSPLSLIYRVNRITKELYRAGFISAAISEGVYDILQEGPLSLEDVRKTMGPRTSREGLKAWLDLGVCLGELRKDSRGYSIKGVLSRWLTDASNDSWQAYFQSRVKVFFNYVIRTLALLRQGRAFEFDQSYGELFARSSRTIEPILLDVVDRIIPRNQPFRLLEVGCGSGIYIKRACDRNSTVCRTGS